MKINMVRNNIPLFIVGSATYSAQHNQRELFGVGSAYVVLEARLCLALTTIVTDK